MNFKGILFILLNLFKFNYSWYTDNGLIYNEMNNQTKLRGISWFGFETQDYVVNGLWVHNMKWYIDLLKSNNFNVIRIPYSSEWIHYNIDKYPDQGIISADQTLYNKKSIEILDELFDYTEQNNILIMLDLHRLHKEYISELWYSPTDQQYTSDTYFSTWFTILDRYKKRK